RPGHGHPYADHLAGLRTLPLRGFCRARQGSSRSLRELVPCGSVCPAMRPTLYHYWRSSASWRVRWALAIKGVAFESVPIDLRTGEQCTAEHRARNPIGHVPALVIDGRALAESVAILEYLEETIPQPALYPRDPWARARTRQLVELINSGVQPMA